ncbi:MAG: tetratricopeptide repeat protein [Synechococcaceae cyanobacterium SM2_3_1]|nr:tetratricopeptide repeat protein [Synechococcaceae cyanobacterium SM2_3_1]
MTNDLSLNAQDHLQLGVMAVQAGDLETAREEFVAVLEAHPSHLETRYKLGWVLASLGAWEEAIQQLRQTLQMQPDHPEANYNLGAILLQKAQVEAAADGRMETAVLTEAKACFEKVLETDPFDQRAFAFINLLKRAIEGYGELPPPTQEE